MTNTIELMPYVGMPKAARNKYVIFDIETMGRGNVDHLIPEPTAPGNVKDPAKVEAAIEAKRKEQYDRLALDMNLNRIVALGMYQPEHGEVRSFVCRDEDEERMALSFLWNAFQPDLKGKSPLIGFCNKRFDVPVCLRRTQLLGMAPPNIDTGKYRNNDVIDLYDILTFDIFNESGVMKRRLKNFCTLFGIPEVDDCDGAEIPELVEAGNWDEVRKHVVADVERTRLLAERIGVI